MALLPLLVPLLMIMLLIMTMMMMMIVDGFIFSRFFSFVPFSFLPS